MKKIKAILAIFVMMFVVESNCFVAQAANADMVVTYGEMTEKALALTELEILQQELEVYERVVSDLSPMATESTDYTAYEYSQSFYFHINDVHVATADATCVVFRYTDGKVHLYSRTISISRLATYAASKTYGSIVNTDGSVCYTTGDRVNIYDYTQTWRYAIDFAATPTGQSFNCYEITY